MPTLAFKTLVLIIAFVTYQPGDLENPLSSSFLTCKSLRCYSMGCLIKNPGAGRRTDSALCPKPG